MEQNLDSWDEDKLLFVTGKDTAIWNFNLFDLTVWTKVTHSNDKARFAITAVLTWSFKICDVFANDYRINLTFTTCMESK